jgi:outer membrane protein TolC
LITAALLSVSLVFAPPPERAADDFRRSDPDERELAPVAESSGLQAETAVPDHHDPLELAELLDALVHVDPRLDAARHDIDAAAGKLMGARGGFDPKLAAAGRITPIGDYPHAIVDVRVEQATPLWGMTAWAGWRVGLGEFAVYDGKLETARGGELRAGVSVPLWRDGAIDRRRADIKVARAGRALADEQYDARQLELELAAARAYYRWVAAGLALDIERELLQLALERDAGLQRKISLGDSEAIVGVDNRRLILDREARVVAAERALQAATLELSLFHRTPDGQPAIVGAERLPIDLPSPTPPRVVDIDAEVEAALGRRPDLAALAHGRTQAEVEVRYARNQRSASVDVSSWVAQDLGVGATSTEWSAMLEIEVPIPMRAARGRYQTARAELAKVDAQLRLARDRVATEVRDAHSELAATYQRAQLTGEQVELARKLAEAQLRQFELGAGDLLLVNLRELAVATARREHIEALAAFFVAQARLDVALGFTVDRATGT